MLIVVGVVRWANQLAKRQATEVINNTKFFCVKFFASFHASRLDLFFAFLSPFRRLTNLHSLREVALLFGSCWLGLESSKFFGSRSLNIVRRSFIIESLNCAIYFTRYTQLKRKSWRSWASLQLGDWQRHTEEIVTTRDSSDVTLRNGTMKSITLEQSKTITHSTFHF